jgi:RNase P/RNase MRP subunit p29
MKIITTAIVSLLFAGSVFAGCPSKAIQGKVVSFDKESKTLTVTQGKKEKKVQVGSKTEMVGFECPTKLDKGTRVSIDGCNCKNKTASKIALSKGKKNNKKES